MLKFKPGRLPAEILKRDEEPSLARESNVGLARRIVVLKFNPGRLPVFL